jgi:hypothetical protein
MGLKRALRIASGGAAAVIALTVVSAGTANAATSCDFSFSTNKYSCNGAGNVTRPGDVIAAKLFDGDNFSGHSLTIWTPRPCVKNGKVDYTVNLGDDLRRKISSVQGWGSSAENGCWVWLNYDDGTRDGPFKGNVPDVGTHANNRATSVGLS